MLTPTDIELVLFYVLLTYAIALPLRVGMLSIGPMAFAGVGAYTFGILSQHTNLSSYWEVIAAVLLCLIAGAAVSVPLAKVSGLFAAIASLALVIICTGLETGLHLTGQSLGIIGIPAGDTRIALGALIVACAVGWLWLDGSQIGRRLDAVRTDPVLAESLGISVTWYRFCVLLISFVSAGVAGALYAHSFYLVTPADFSFLEAVQVSAYAVVAGGVFWAGPLIAGAALALIPVLGRSAGNYGLMASGVLMVLTLTVYPGGVGGAFRRLLRGRGIRQRREYARSTTPLDTSDRILGPTQGASAPPEIQLENVSKSFGGVRALSSVTLSIRGAGVVGVVGPNGSGKSTLLAIISGLLHPDDGTVTVNGRRVERAPSRSIARYGLARTFQHPRLVPDLRMWENMELGRRGTGPSRAAIETTRLVGMEAVAQRWPDQVTLSEQRRAEIGRALTSGARIILLDEPAAGLTELETERLAGLIGELGHHLLVVIVEHNVELIGRLAPRAVVLLQGRLAADAAPAELWRNEAVRSAYLATAEETIEPGTDVSASEVGEQNAV